jgi:hypothetical protein
MDQNKKSLAIISGVILLAALTRLIPHYPNFTAIGAVAILGGATLKDKWLAILVPLAALWVSDLILMNTIYASYTEGFSFMYTGFLWVYGAFVVNALMGRYMMKLKSWKSMAFTGVSAAIVFFLITNLGTWITDPMYTKDFSGLMTSYAMGLPFLGAQIAGNLFYGAIMAGVLSVSLLKEQRA